MWFMMVFHSSVNWVIIGSVDDLLPVQHQAITSTMLIYYQLDHEQQTSLKFEFEYKT